MAIRTAIIGGIVSFCLICASCRTPRLAPAAEEAASRLADDFFPIMCWEALRSDQNFQFYDDPHAGIASLKECNFNTVGFIRPENITACEKLGLRAILRPAGHPIRWTQLSDEQIDAAVREMIAEAGNSPAIIGYYIVDEPGTTQFPALAKAVAAVKKHASGKLAYINLYPNYATLGAPNLSQLGTENYVDYLERFVSEVKPQFISYDNYRILFSDDLRKPEIAQSYFTNLLEVRRVAHKHGLPFWNICSSNQIRPHTPPPSPANLQLQAYTTLAAGAHNLTWFTYYPRKYSYAAIDPNRNRTATWSYLQMVNHHVATLGPLLRPMTSTGVYFTSPAPQESLPLLPGKLIQAIESPTALMIGEFRSPTGDKRYAMIVNLSLERSSKIKLTPAAGFALAHHISPADGSAQPLDGDNTLWLTAGQGALILLR